MLPDQTLKSCTYTSPLPITDPATLTMSVHSKEPLSPYCRTIWGPGNYSLDIATDDYEWYQIIISDDLGDSIRTKAMTPLCNGEDKAWAEAARMLTLMAECARSGVPMSREKRVEIFSGPRGEHRVVIEKCIDMVEWSRASDAAAAREQARLGR